jgi:uncharacterized protein YhhL (DUF1145 family)
MCLIPLIVFTLSILMKPYLITVINSITLIVMGLWGYFSSESPSFTALIPVFAGVILLALAGGFRKRNTTIAHIIVIFTLIVLIALIKPLSGTLSRNDHTATARVMVMMITCILALFTYIKSFIDARKQRG